MLPAPHDSQLPVVIVGAGVAGLTCALALARAGRRVLVLEREPEVGGRVRSRVVDGYTVDRGFQVLFTAYPTLADALGLELGGREALRLRAFAPAARVVTGGPRAGAPLVGDALRAPSLLAPTVFAGALGAGDKLRVLALRRLARRLSVEECFAERFDAVPARAFLRARGFTERAVAHFFAPFYGGILLDPALGASAAVLLFTFKMLAEGDTAVPAGGMGDVTRRLAERLTGMRPGAVRTGVGVDAVLAEGGRAAGVRTARGERVAAAHVVLAAEGPAAARLAGTAGVRLAAPDHALGCATVNFAARDPVLPGRALWLNAAAASPTVIHAVTLTDVAPEYAAPGAPYGPHLVAATAVGEGAALDAAVLEARARVDLDAMRRAAGLGALPPMVAVAVERVPYAQFAQPPGVRARRTGASAGLPGLWRASETAHSSSLEGAARGGALAAEGVLADVVLAAA